MKLTPKTHIFSKMSTPITVESRDLSIIVTDAGQYAKVCAASHDDIYAAIFNLLQPSLDAMVVDPQATTVTITTGDLSVLVLGASEYSSQFRKDTDPKNLLLVDAMENIEKLATAMSAKADAEALASGVTQSQVDEANEWAKFSAQVIYAAMNP